MNFGPDVGVRDGRDEASEAVVSHPAPLLARAFQGLQGITAMDTAGTYFKTISIHSERQVTSYAIAADYEPPAGSPLKRVAQDLAIDALFSGDRNDLVVPTSVSRPLLMSRRSSRGP